MAENEANLGALAHLRSGPTPVQNFVYVSGEIGVGTGLVIGGELYRRLDGFAGELGHVVVEHNGPPCSCWRSPPTKDWSPRCCDAWTK